MNQTTLVPHPLMPRSNTQLRDYHGHNRTIVVRPGVTPDYVVIDDTQLSIKELLTAISATLPDPEELFKL